MPLKFEWLCHGCSAERLRLRPELVGHDSDLKALYPHRNLKSGVRKGQSELEVTPQALNPIPNIFTKPCSGNSAVSQTIQMKNAEDEIYA